MAGEVALPRPMSAATNWLGKVAGPVRTVLLWVAGAGLVGFLLGLSLEILIVFAPAPSGVNRGLVDVNQERATRKVVNANHVRILARIALCTSTLPPGLHAEVRR